MAQSLLYPADTKTNANRMRPTSATGPNAEFMETPREEKCERTARQREDNSCGSDRRGSRLGAVLGALLRRNRANLSSPRRQRDEPSECCGMSVQASAPTYYVRYIAAEDRLPVSIDVPPRREFATTMTRPLTRQLIGALAGARAKRHQAVPKAVH